MMQKLRHHRTGRRGCSRKCLAASLLVFITAGGLASSQSAPVPAESLPSALDASIAKGLSFLARQQAGDGSFGTEGPKLATTGLSLLAFLATGNAPDLGKYGLAVHNAVDYLLVQQAPDGYFGGGDRGMYAHAIVTLALCEDYGVESTIERRSRIRAALAKAIDSILAAQNAPKANPLHVGGWRYERNSNDSDMSLSAWNVLALRAAEDAGLSVAKAPEVRQRAADFVLKCYDEPNKGFCYQPGAAAQSGDTAIGMLCLYALDASASNAPKVEAAGEFLVNHPIDENAPFFYYSAYYIVQASFQRGGAHWPKVGLSVLDRLIKMQQADDGGWPASKNAQEPGRVYATAMALQSLAVPYRLLPVYQR